MSRGRGGPRPLLRELQARFPDLEDPAEAVLEGRVLVDGRPILNPESQVRAGASVSVKASRSLRGAAKLAAALERFPVTVAGRVALDLGASTGGFTSVLLARGAARVYAVDVGHGQLLGSLRQDARVVNLEATNLAQLDGRLLPEPVQLVTADLSFVALARAVPQLDAALLAGDVELVALVKPMFELGLAQPPASAAQLAEAVERAASGVARAGWDVLDSVRSPVPGAGGAVEFLLHARWRLA
jgi:23S rRNA (cytidine1920-2'-O)/16S rRNA (cytidine1409-2'-O)-methyltransferase